MTILAALKAADKYAALDLWGCTGSVSGGGPYTGTTIERRPFKSVKSV
ncbi:MAG: hypothetical protein LBP80_06420 [Treponema sp.]|nr:hypothetical protein [Treponema sp.]